MGIRARPTPITIGNGARVAKLKNDPIASADMIEFLDTSSDFAFELTCVNRLSELGFSCQHGGSYTDPVTKKARQFDIRARKDDDRQLLRVRCAIECKNLTKAFPLLVMCVPRARGESFHELLFSFDPDQMPRSGRFDVPAFRKICQAIRVDHNLSEYRAQSPVGKSLAQIGRASDGTLITNDAEVFEKWSQALASASDLADEAACDGETHESAFISLVLPILVVPDGALWKVDYCEDGARNSDPVQVDRCSFFIGRDYEAGDRVRGSNLTISHIEFVTLSGLDDLTKSILCPGDSWFPPLETIQRLFEQQSQ
jgi:hypothetical protein